MAHHRAAVDRRLHGGRGRRRHRGPLAGAALRRRPHAHRCASIALALAALRLAARPARGSYTYGLKRAEILSAQANGLTLLLLAAFFVYEGIWRLIDPPEV